MHHCHYPAPVNINQNLYKDCTGWDDPAHTPDNEDYPGNSQPFGKDVMSPEEIRIAEGRRSGVGERRKPFVGHGNEDRHDAEQVENVLFKRLIKRRGKVGQLCLNDDVNTEAEAEVANVRKVMLRLLQGMLPEPSAFEHGGSTENMGK